MLGYQSYSHGPILSQISPNSVQIAAYNSGAVLQNKDLSYVIYLEDTFQSDIFTMRLSLLHLIIRMKIEGTEDPLIPDPQCSLDELWFQNHDHLH